MPSVKVAYISCMDGLITVLKLELFHRLGIIVLLTPFKNQIARMQEIQQDIRE